MTDKEKKTVSAYMAMIGRKGGLAGTPAQAEARRRNGSRPVRPGSRPRGRPKKTARPPEK